jgi:VWFA-related protein
MTARPLDPDGPLLGRSRGAELRASRKSAILGRMCISVALVLPLCPATLTRSQQPSQPPTISTQVKVVNVLATVRDKHGKIVPNLTQQDFELEEDGRPETISYFSRETDLPLTLGLLVDTSLSQRRVLDEERNASLTFLDQVLRVDKDVAFVIHFDREVELLQDFTSSRQKLQAALNLLQTPQFNRDGGGGGGGDPDSQAGPRGGRPHHFGGGGTLLYDSIYLASNEMMSKRQGRKALLVLSDGVDRGSKETLASAMEAAQRADTLVYSILFTDDEGFGNHRGFGGPGMGGMGGMGRRGGMGRGGGWPGRYPEESRPDGKKILERISKETGGRMFEVTKKQPIDAIYDQIQEELRNQYSLGYTPNPPDSGAGYHKIRVEAKGKNLVVQARDGYYSN